MDLKLILPFRHRVENPLLDRDFAVINIITLVAADNIQQTTQP